MCIGKAEAAHARLKKHHDEVTDNLREEIRGLTAANAKFEEGMTELKHAYANLHAARDSLCDEMKLLMQNYADMFRRSVPKSNICKELDKRVHDMQTVPAQHDPSNGSSSKTIAASTPQTSKSTRRWFHTNTRGNAPNLRFKNKTEASTIWVLFTPLFHS